MREDFLMYGSPFIILLAVQLICCFVFKNKYLRHAGLALIVILLIMAVWAYFSDPGFIIGGNVFMMYVFFVMAASGLAGYGAAWGIYCLFRRKR